MAATFREGCAAISAYQKEKTSREAQGKITLSIPALYCSGFGGRSVPRWDHAERPHGAEFDRERHQPLLPPSYSGLIGHIKGQSAKARPFCVS